MLERRVATILCLFAAVLLNACSTSGIRKLSDVETEYFSKLKVQLQDSAPRLRNLLEKRTASNEEMALLQVASLDDTIRRAKLVYSLREVLTAPESDSAKFVQVTRNKVILYHLAEASQARNEKQAADLAKGKEERSQLVSDLHALSKLVNETVASNELLHNHLNQSGTAQLTNFIAEVGHQVTAFNEGIKAADQNNTVIQHMVETGKVADRHVQRAEEGLSKFIDVWSNLNEKKK